MSKRAAFQKAWKRKLEQIGHFQTQLLLIVVYFLLIMPIGLLRQLFSANVFRSTLNRQNGTYFKPCTPRPIQHMEKPY